MFIEHRVLLLMCMQLVEDDLRFEAQEQMAAEADSDNNLLMLATDALSSIPAVHLTFNLIRCRVHIFSQLVEAWPECVSILRRNRQPMVCVSRIFICFCFKSIIIESTFHFTYISMLVYSYRKYY